MRERAKPGACFRAASSSCSTSRGDIRARLVLEIVDDAGGVSVRRRCDDNARP